MKRVLLVLFLITISAAVFSQTDPIASMDAIADGLQSFTNAIAPSIPLNSTTGNIWSDAYIGQLIGMPPHFGVGAVLGFTFIPGSYLETLIGGISGEATGLDLPDILLDVGIPIPAIVTNARIGGFILPFDIGVKFGMIPVEQQDALAALGLNISYTLVGGDIRYALLNEKKNIIDLSVGLSLNYLSTSISIPTGMGETTYDFTLPDSSTHTLALSEPQLYLGWNTFAADLTAQVSKRILFFTPYAGAGLCIGTPRVQTGIKSQLTYDGQPMTDAQMTELQTLYDNLVAMGLPAPVDPASLTEGYIFDANINRGTDLRVYGGFSLDIWVVRLDLNVLYSFLGRNYGANLGARIQL